MKKIINILGVAVTLLALGACNNDGGSTTETPENLPSPVAIAKSNTMKLYMHYMPWFETKESSADGKWGYHWTMSKMNPDKILPDGTREIASFYHPLIGPYHSGDDAVIENHLLTMKYAGIDGILINWYGTFDLNDYRINKINSDEIIKVAKRLGMDYAIVYEDRFLPDIVNAGMAPVASSAARVDLNYINKYFFTDANYIKVDNKPLLLNFGPVTMKTSDQWDKAFSIVDKKPVFLTLWDQSYMAGANASGEFAWVYKNSDALINFYKNTAPKLGYAMASAYPSFKDFYEQGGGGSGIGWTIEPNNGATLNETLQLAKNSGLKSTQLITWNDFGEGTTIEPTKEFGYSYVEKIKDFAGVQNTVKVFPELTKMYNLRLKYPSNTENKKKLDRATALFAAMQTDEAIKILNEIQ